MKTTSTKPTSHQQATKLAFLSLVVICFSSLWLTSSAQAYEVAILKSADIAAYNQAIGAFKTNLSPNITTTLEYNLQGDLGRGRTLARRIRGSDVHLVLAVGLKAALVAKLEIPSIPIIFCMVLNPGKYDLTSPNIAGIALEISFERQVTSLRQLLPEATRIGVIFDPDQSARAVEEARRQAKSLGLSLVAREVISEKEVPETLRTLVPDIEALWLHPDSTVLTEDSLNFILSTTLEANVPIIGFSSGLVRSGALVGLLVNYEDIGEQAAYLAKGLMNSHTQVLGTVMPPKRLRLAINLKTAKFLGIPIRPDVLKQFDEVY